MQYESFLQLVKSRRSIYQYKQDPVADEDIEKVIDAARWAPSGFNSQLWEFVVVRKPELRQQIGDIVGEARKNILKGKVPAQQEKVDSPKNLRRDGKKPRFSFSFLGIPGFGPLVMYHP